MNELVPNHGEQYLRFPTSEARFSEGISRHHRPFYNDYDEAKIHILQSIGSIADFDLFGRNVLIAVFCRPCVMPVGRDGKYLIMTIKEIKEDWYQHKAALILKAGPDAFTGDDSYLRAQFGDAPPKPGEWVFSNANDGMQMNLAGDGASRPQREDSNGEMMPLFGWEGWPVRIIADDRIIGRILNPQSIV